MYNEIISEKLKALNVSDYGFAYMGDTDGYKYPSLPYAISIVIKLSDFVVDEIDDAPTFSYFHHYRTVNSFIDSVMLQTGLLIERQGYKFLPIAASQSVRGGDDRYTGVFQHKTAARMAGLGSIGKSGLFLSDKFGPRVRLGTILTDMPFDTATPHDNDVCIDCDACVRACPAMAITGNAWHEGATREEIVSAQACSEYMKAKFQHIGRGVVCGICMKVCPVNRIKK